MEAAKKAIKVGWIGTGVMGKSMAGHLMRNGYSLSVYNRTASKADELVSNGAEFKQPIDIAKSVDYLFLMLGYPFDVEKVVFDEKEGIL
jgi:3-hydroxyisobutyrate dehydrogenase